MISSIIHRTKVALGVHWQHHDVLGQRVKTRLGTFRKEADYDDAWFLACCRHATVLFDVGANVGYDSLLALLYGSIEHATLFEPNREALALAIENLEANGLDSRIDVLSSFAADRNDDEIDFFTEGAGAAGSMFASHAVSGGKLPPRRVQTVTLDAIVSSGARVPDLIKIDVEGAEALVLSGARQLATEHRPRFLVEMHSSPELSMAENASRVLAWCNQVGYRAYYLKHHEELTCPDQIAERGRCHLLLQHALTPYPEWLRGIPQGASLSLAVL